MGDSAKTAQESFWRDLPMIRAVTLQNHRKGFHMPGNRGGKAFSQSFRRALPHLDCTELCFSGDINEPEGAVAESLALISEIFGAGASFYCPSGSTTAVKIAIATAFRPKDKVIITRGCHISAANAIAMLDLTPLIVPGRTPAAFPSGLVAEADVLRALQMHPEAHGVILTSPTYYGETLKLKKICELAHAQGQAVIVDEAHGAHFYFSDILPEGALTQGADLVVQSAHKTLPALTPASLLHVSKNFVSSGNFSRTRLIAMMHIFQTSSPSFMITASTEYAVHYMAKFGTAAIAALLQKIASFREALPEPFFCESNDDPTRLVINFSDLNVSSAMMLAQLQKYQLDVEMLDLRRMVLILSLDTPPSYFAALLNCLHEAVKAFGEKPNYEQKKSTDKTLEKKLMNLFSRSADFALRPGAAIFAEPLTDKERFSSDFIVNSPVAPYPPGAVTYFPGEIIRNEDMKTLQALWQRGFTIRGILAKNWR